MTNSIQLPAKSAKSTAPQPQPGDAVRLDGKCFGAQPGQIAIIDGTHYHFLGETEVMLIFAYSAYREEINGHLIVSCSGGPCPFVDERDLELVGTRVCRFWRWRDYRLPQAHDGVEYQLEVPLWKWNGKGWWDRHPREEAHQ